MLDAGLVAALLAHWEQGEKLQDRVASAQSGAGITANIKRRSDVFLDDRGLYARSSSAWSEGCCR